MSAPERAEIEAAMQRLLAGAPLRSSGELTVVQLAAEAGVKRWRLTHQHVDLMREFQAAVQHVTGASRAEARLRDRVSELEADLAAARLENAEVRESLAVYAQVVADLDAALNAVLTTPSTVRPIRQ